MNLSSTITDNIAELLAKIIEFTERRHQILMHNIEAVETPGFVPGDLDVAEFADLITEAVSEHVRSRRLLLRDSENVKFGPGGNFETIPIVDDYAKWLFENDTEKYLKLQIDKLCENLVNKRTAVEMLDGKQR
ncbi:MAG: hypothetical protein DRP65_11285 [Planctomycetota bacterium]|nr:MAG: hypothetical protein DRP65_11285 [Planctomycetota bacterium]